MPIVSIIQTPKLLDNFGIWRITALPGSVTGLMTMLSKDQAIRILY